MSAPWGTLLPPLTSASRDLALLDFEQAGRLAAIWSKGQRVEESKGPRVEAQSAEREEQLAAGPVREGPHSHGAGSGQVAAFLNAECGMGNAE